MSINNKHKNRLRQHKNDSGQVIEEKLCSDCQQWFPHTKEYFNSSGHRNKEGKLGLRGNCKACYYQKKNLGRDKKIREQYYSYKMSLNCSICGFPDNNDLAVHGDACYKVIEFNHRDPSQKFRNVSDMVPKFSWDKILNEIEKCDPMCANCHRLYTFT